MILGTKKKRRKRICPSLAFRKSWNQLTLSVVSMLRSNILNKRLWEMFLTWILFKINYCFDKKGGQWESEKTFDLNEYIDIIVSNVFEYAGTRNIMFSCFHPDICSLYLLNQMIENIIKSINQLHYIDSNISKTDILCYSWLKDWPKSGRNSKTREMRP